MTGLPRPDARKSARPLVVGVGNPQRGDDAIGPMVVEHLAALPSLRADTEIVTGDCTGLVDRMKDHDRLIIIDACQSGAPAGTLFRFDLADGPLPAHAGGVSTHGFGVAEALALALSLGQRPARCVVFAVEAGGFEFGEPLTVEVRDALEDLVGAVRSELLELQE